jgi:hypothetical protein
MQFLHCVRPASEGGASLLSDAITSAKVLKERNPSYYETLCKVKFEFEDLIAQPWQMKQHFLINSSSSGASTGTQRLKL